LHYFDLFLTQSFAAYSFYFKVFSILPELILLSIAKKERRILKKYLNFTQTVWAFFFV